MAKTDKVCAHCGRPSLGEFCGRHTPEYLQKMRDYMREYQKKPEVKAKARETYKLKKEIKSILATDIQCQ